MKEFSFRKCHHIFVFLYICIRKEYQILALTLATLISIFSEAIIYIIFGRLLNTLLNNILYKNYSDLPAIHVRMLILYFIYAAVCNLTKVLKVGCGKKIQKIFLFKILSELLKLSYKSYYTTSFTRNTRLINEMLSPVEKLRKAVMLYAPYTLIYLVCLIYELSTILQTKIMLLFAVYLTFYVLIVVIYSMGTYRMHGNVLLQYSKTLFKVQSFLDNFELTKTYNKEHCEWHQYKKDLNIFCNSIYGRYRESCLHDMFLKIMRQLAFFVIIYFYIADQSVLKVDKSCMLRFLLIYNKLSKILGILKTWISDITESVMKLNFLLEIVKKHKEFKNLQNPTVVDGSVELSEANLFDFDGIFLKNLSFKFKKGDRVAIVGSMGTGKSILFKSLLKFFDHSGLISIDGVSLKNIEEMVIRNNIAYVPQTPYIMNDTVLYNLGYSQETICEDEIYRQCEEYGCNELFKNLKDGYLTLAGKNGLNLSGGQKQRISFMRAIIKNAPIIILDNPTAHIDHDAELELIDKLLKNEKDKTIFVITYNPAIMQKFDKILHFQNDSVTFFNSYEEYNKR